MYAKFPFMKQEMFNIDKIRATCHCFGARFVYIEHFRHSYKVFRNHLLCRLWKGEPLWRENLLGAFLYSQYHFCC